jgi:hypothetical protein
MRTAFEAGQPLTVEVRGAAIPLRLAKPPLHKLGELRIKN